MASGQRIGRVDLKHVCRGTKSCWPVLAVAHRCLESTALRDQGLSTQWFHLLWTTEFICILEGRLRELYNLPGATAGKWVSQTGFESYLLCCGLGRFLQASVSSLGKWTNHRSHFTGWLWGWSDVTHARCSTVLASPGVNKCFSLTHKLYSVWEHTMLSFFPPVSIFLKPVFYLFLFFNCFILLRDWMGEGRGQRIQSGLCEPSVGLEPTNCEMVTWAEVGCSTDWAMQAPQASFSDIDVRPWIA